MLTTRIVNPSTLHASRSGEHIKQPCYNRLGTFATLGIRSNKLSGGSNQAFRCSGDAMRIVASYNGLYGPRQLQVSAKLTF